MGEKRFVLQVLLYIKCISWVREMTSCVCARSSLCKRELWNRFTIYGHFIKCISQPKKMNLELYFKSHIIFIYCISFIKA